MNKTIAKTAEAPSRTLFTGEQVLDLLDSDVEEDYDGEMDEVFPGSNDELGFLEEEIGDGRFVKKFLHEQVPYLTLCSYSDDDGNGDERDSDSGYGM